MTALGSLWTLGYSGMSSAADLAELMQGTGVTTIVDVRLRPFGRTPFGGPRASRDTVEALGIAYRWDQRLGNLDYRTGGIRIKDIEAIEQVLDDLRNGANVALMCVCATPTDCHRLALCEEAARRLPGLKVVHLTRRRPAAFLAADATDEQIGAFVDALLPHSQERELR